MLIYIMFTAYTFLHGFSSQLLLKILCGPFSACMQCHLNLESETEKYIDMPTDSFLQPGNEPNIIIIMLRAHNIV